MTVSNELIDQLLAGYKKPEDLIGENGLLKRLFLYARGMTVREIQEASPGHVWHRGLSDTDLIGHRCRHGRGQGLADTSTEGVVPHRFSGLHSWRSNWQRIVPFFGYPPEIRRIIYTTNAIESVNMSLRKVTQSRVRFPAMAPQVASNTDRHCVYDGVPQGTT